MKVSVIIPIYNTGIYLKDCLKSICNQSYRDLQIIMIDDGSETETADICDEIAASDQRICLIHKQNEGVSIARNTGLSVADGDVVCFVDSDDTIEPDMIESFVSALSSQNAQIAMCDAVTITPGLPDSPDTIMDYDTSCCIDVKNMKPDTLTRFAGSACRCAYRRTDTLLAAQARFPERLKFSEDRIFNIMAMSGAKRIAYIKRPLYRRLIRNGSACFRFYPDMTEQIEKVRSVLIPIVRERWGEQYIPAYEAQIAGHIRYAITNFTSPSAGLSFSETIGKLRGLCSSDSIRDCLRAQPAIDRRSSMILNNKYVQLYLFGKLINLYHRLCHKGQYQV